MIFIHHWIVFHQNNMIYTYLLLRYYDKLPEEPYSKSRHRQAYLRIFLSNNYYNPLKSWNDTSVERTETIQELKVLETCPLSFK